MSNYDLLDVNEDNKGKEFGFESVISNSTREKIKHVSVKDAVQEIREGAELYKYISKISIRKPHRRVFKVDMEVLVLRWFNKEKQEKKIYLTDVDRVIPGEDSDFWRNKTTSERQLGIELITASNAIRLQCKDNKQWTHWIKGLLYAHEKASARKNRAGAYAADFVEKQWELADLDQSGSIQLTELVCLLQRLNCNTDVRYVELLFNQYDEDGSRVLEYDEFRLFLHKLMTHDDVCNFFNDYVDADQEDIMTESNFIQFLIDVQRTPKEQVNEGLKLLHEFDDTFIFNKGLTRLGFNLLICSHLNSIMIPSKTTVYQDMTQPLSQYWISSSHNTYLTGDQVVGKSAVGQYIEVLLQGCRCVELDVWDGPDGEPIIYHGHTLTSKIKFADVIRACKDYGFQTSPYPVILSLEMHCTAKQKIRAGYIMKEILGDSLYIRNSNSTTDVSPEELKLKFIVKGRVPDAEGTELQEGNEEELILEEEEMELEIQQGYPDEYTNDILKLRSKILSGDKSKVKKLDKNMEVYYNSISLSGRSLESFNDENRRSHDICSLSESKLLKLAKSHPDELANFHRHYLSRIYPAGTRLMSSNYNPCIPWLMGCQIVALNYQVSGIATLLNYGKFLDNGGCGYILKPDIMRLQQSVFNPFDISNQITMLEIPCQLTIQILAAQQIPHPAFDVNIQSNRRKDSVSPFITVALHGSLAPMKSFRTPHCLNNGLNPKWTNQIFTFEVAWPSFSVVLFEVKNYDAVRPEFLAASAVPVSCIRTGLRWVPLCDSRFRKINWSGLIVHVSIKRRK